MFPALVLAAVYVVLAPPSADLAAQTFRADLFSEHGFVLWSNAWYSGHHVPGYSLLFPPLASVLGVRLVGALAAVAAAALFAALVRPRYGDRATVAIWLFGIGSATNLFTGRLTFALGLALGVAAMLALRRWGVVTAAVLAVLCSLGSPVAGLFLALVGAVAFLCGDRRGGLALAIPALATIAALALAFPTGGVEPFAANTFALIAAALVILLLALPARERELRLGVVLYVAICLVLFVLPTPVGGNATRLGALMAAPLLALGAVGVRRPAVVAVALVPLLYWQWVAPVRDLSDAVGDPSVEPSYYEPLLAELERRGGELPFRVQVPPTRNRWEAVHVGERYPLARGWLRQAESGDFDLFRDGSLDASSYREWLDRRAVAFVAIADVEADYLSEDEIELVRGGLPYLKHVWGSADWELYEVDDPAPLAEAPARLTELGVDWFSLEAPAAGVYSVRVSESPYWRVVGGDGCVEAEDGLTRVRLDEPGPVRVEAQLSLGALIGREPGCSA